MRYCDFNFHDISVLETGEVIKLKLPPTPKQTHTKNPIGGKRAVTP